MKVDNKKNHCLQQLSRLVVVGECRLGLEDGKQLNSKSHILDAVTYPYLMILNCSERDERLSKHRLGLQSTYLQTPLGKDEKGG
jgi:hypothetical protein